MRRPRILLLGGSLSRPSHTAALLRAAERVFAVNGGGTCRWEIAVRPLPPLEPGVDSDPQDQTRRALLVAADAADAMVIASPVYHCSYSGVVKDALDHLSPLQLAGKPVALLSNSGGTMSTQALDHLRLVVRALQALAIPRQVVTIDSDFVLDGDHYCLASADIDARLQALAHDVLWLAGRLRRDDDGAPVDRNRREAPQRVLATTRRT
jgi:azobenzene reductase